MRRYRVLLVLWPSRILGTDSNSWLPEEPLLPTMAAQPTMGKENVQTATKQEPPALATLDLERRRAASITGTPPPPAATPSKPPAPLLTPRSAPPPPPPPAPIACPRIEAKDFETLGGKALEAAHAKPGRVDVVVAEGTTLAGTIKVPAGVRLVGSAGTRPIIMNTLH